MNGILKLGEHVKGDMVHKTLSSAEKSIFFSVYWDVLTNVELRIVRITVMRRLVRREMEAR